MNRMNTTTKNILRNIDEVHILVKFYPELIQNGGYITDGSIMSEKQNPPF
jgi:hypothetical protein